MKLKKQKGEIATALCAFLLGLAWASLATTTVTCDFESAGHPECANHAAE